MLIKSILFCFLSILINFLLIRFLIRFAWKINLVETHENFLENKVTVPSLGGIGIYITFLIIVLLNPKILFLKITQGILIGGTLMLLVGFVDDRIELSPLIKIVSQFLVALILICFGVKTEIIYLSPSLNLVITILWIVGITNALNLLDIMDSLCGGISLIIALTFFTFALIGGNFLVAVISITLAGSLLAFLRYNFPPAKIFLGNSGSLFLGFIFSALAIILRYAPMGQRVTLLTPLVILTLPIYDTFFVMLMRIIRRKSIFLKTKDHLVMRFLAKGYSEKGALIRMFILSIGLSIAALLISLTSDLFGLCILVIVIIFLVILTKKMGMVRVE